MTVKQLTGAPSTNANLTLDGIEPLIKSLTRRQDKVHFIRYADDFIITGSSKELLEEQIKPAIKNFLAIRGLTLSDEKTRITHIDEGFDFLGFNVRKYKGKLLTD
jgi:RNA-directed DNA polymerase